MKRLISILILFALLLASPGWAAIAFVSVLDAAAAVNVGSITQSVTVTSGSNLAMVVAGQHGSSGTVCTITGVVFNTSETFTRGARTGGAVGLRRTELWYLANPTVTTANVVVTYGCATDDRGQLVSILQFSGVDQASPLDSASDDINCPTGSANCFGTTQNFSLTTNTTVNDNAWLVESLVTKDDGIPAMGAQTNRTQRTNRTTNTITGAITTLGPKTPVGGQTMDWTESASPVSWDWDDCFIALKPAVVAGGNFRTLMGVGQ